MSSFRYAYNQANQRTQVTNTDNSHWVYQYDKLGQVTAGKKYWSDGTPVAGQQFTYNFDDIGNRQSTASGGDPSGASLRPASYTANNLNQYTSRDVPGYVTELGSANSNATITVNMQRAVWQGSYFWDELPENNRGSSLYVSLTNLGVLNYGTNAAIVATNIGKQFLPQTPESFGYDGDGNMTNSGCWTITWDAENRAISITSLSTSPLASQYKVDCVYDFQGRRIQKIVSTNSGSVWVPVSTNKFVYDGWNLAGILDGNNNLLNSFTWGSDLSGSILGAGGVGGLLSMTVYSGLNAGTYDYTYDGNGDVEAIVNGATGTVAGQWEYGPFGEVIRSTGPMAKANPIRFSTKFEDDETGLNYYGYRYYDPNAGMWLSRDPIEEDGGYNLCGFIGNDGINCCDGFGLWLIHRNPDNERAVAYAEKGDTADGLAKMMGFDGTDFGAWLKPEGQGKLPTTATEAVPSCLYTIPNTIYIEFGTLGGDNWTYGTSAYLQRWGAIPRWRKILTAFGNDKKAVGYHVVVHQAGSARAATALTELHSDNIYGFAFAGHGSGNGTLVFGNSRDASGQLNDYLSAGRQTKYGIAFLIAYGCDTANEKSYDSLLPGWGAKMGYEYSPWEKSVATRGFFIGEFGLIGTDNMLSNRIETPGTNKSN